MVHFFKWTIIIIIIIIDSQLVCYNGDGKGGDWEDTSSMVV